MIVLYWNEISISYHIIFTVWCMCNTFHITVHDVTQCLSLIRHTRLCYKAAVPNNTSASTGLCSLGILVFLHQIHWVISNGLASTCGKESLQFFDQYLAISHKWYRTTVNSYSELLIGSHVWSILSSNDTISSNLEPFWMTYNYPF